MWHHYGIWIFISFRIYQACTYIDHGSYRKGSSSNLLYSTSGTLEFCKMECSSNPSCKGFGRMSGNCYFSSSSVPMSTTCSGCSFYTKDNCDTTTETAMSSTVPVFQYTTLQPAATTNSIQNGTGQALCVCSCSQNGTIPTATLAPHESLVIDKKGLSSYRNSRICIADNRPSAVALGSLGVGIIVLFALLIVLPDAVRLLRFIVNKC
ncbi:uncharacterized protein LOC128180706 isoform X2 [Crassostrea angulata]|nr:uncharacterized protein LOC128180706 isoform X2 [Crassostrea angulata]XP_052704812.1 uncharacterized protein LOC128180706 isoform X2 [Crassostrea angulata]XP_052704820.1 uncharacterized protein LOC128180706 isoform X2 [Crassostrea angulata]XP_052704830.1 uncharacterized protein LOC128180706 isoform X2 [Crassostrea angulata]